MARPRIHDESLRVRLLARAGEIVSRGGVDALTLRGLAAAENTSTTAVYALFGGKPELLGALYGDAFTSFGAAQRAAMGGRDVLVDLRSLGAAYRSWALAHPALYAVMFGGSLAGFEPGPADREQALGTMGPLTETVARGVSEGLIKADPQVASLAIWGMVHGLVSLELTGSCPPADDPGVLYWRAVDAMLTGILA